MILEVAVVTLLLAVVTLPLAVMLFRSRYRGLGVGALALWAVGSAAMAWTSARYPTPPVEVRTADLRPLEVNGDGYVSSDACQSCHPREYHTWDASYHSRMTQAATPETVLAPWDGVRVRARGQDYLFMRQGDEFWVEMDDPEWTGLAGTAPRVWRQVVQITGSHHWQFYWYATGHSRKLVLLLCSYRVADDPRWMPLDGCCVSPPTLGQASGIARWSISCNKCHATHGRPRVFTNTNIDTRVAELGIACEACHGPGETHVAANRNPRRRYDLHLSGEADPTIVNPERLSYDLSSQVCGNCHSVNRFRSSEDRQNWSLNGFRFRPGDEIEDSRQVDRATGEDKFWADGMIRISGRDYNGLIESPCYERGDMSCLSCHQMHPSPDDPRPIMEWANDQLRPGMNGDVACTQCHEQYRDEETVVAHTHHLAGSSGSSCYNCHMPYTTYGLLKAIRTHEVNSPDVAASVGTGRPNACNQCHLDTTMEWAADHLASWYGIPKPELTEEERTIAASLLWGIKGDAGQRALMAWSLGWDEARAASGHDWMVPFLTVMLSDPYHAVRYIAHRSLRSLPDYFETGYDFMDPQDERFRESYELFNRWAATAAPKHVKASPALLIDDDRQVDMETVNRLISERDNREITLNE